MIFDAQLDRSAFGMGFDENDAILAALQFVVLFESLLVFLELRWGHKIYQ